MPYDPFNAVDSRFEGLDARVGGVEERLSVMAREVSELQSRDATMSQQIADMVSGFHALRTAIYYAAGSILVAAITVILIGKPI